MKNTRWHDRPRGLGRLIITLTLAAHLISCGESGALDSPAKIAPNLSAERLVASSNGMQFRFATIPNIGYPAGFFRTGREYLWAFQMTLASAETYQIAFISDSFAVPNTYDLGDILAGGSADIYKLQTIGDTTSFQRIESAVVRQAGAGLVLDISGSEILRPKLEATPPSQFTAIAEGNMMVSQTFTCSYANGICGDGKNSFSKSPTHYDIEQ